MENSEVLSLTADIVSAYVENHTVPTAELPDLIAKVSLALRNTPLAVQQEQAQPAVSVRASVHDNGITCLDCGMELKMLKRHLSTHHSMTPDDYRARWGLNSDYPLVAPNYADKRRDLAVKIGLGRKPGIKRGRKPKG